MKIDDNFLQMSRNQVGQSRNEELRKEQAANDFEEIFARHLVKEMTKDAFEMKGSGPMGNANSMYREHITEALSKELASQRKLGMADLVTRYWNSTPGSDEIQPINKETKQ